MFSLLSQTICIVLLQFGPPAKICTLNQGLSEKETIQIPIKKSQSCRFSLEKGGLKKRGYRIPGNAEKRGYTTHS